MHTFGSPEDRQITVAAPACGELLVGNPQQAWQPAPANTLDEVKVLTQKLAEIPVWTALHDLPDPNHVLQQPAIADPIAPTFGLSAVEEMQFILLQVLQVLRAYQMIES